MKRFLLTATVLLFAVQIFAQEQPKRPDREPAKVPAQSIKVKKIAFFTDQLQLTPEEAEKFWPVYNANEQAAGEAREETHKANIALTKAVREEGTSDAEIKELAKKYEECIDKEGELLKKQSADYQKVLPIRKAVMVNVVEQRFMHELINNLRGGEAPKDPQKPMPRERGPREKGKAPQVQQPEE